MMETTVSRSSSYTTVLRFVDAFFKQNRQMVGSFDLFMLRSVFPIWSLFMATYKILKSLSEISKSYFMMPLTVVMQICEEFKNRNGCDLSIDLLWDPVWKQTLLQYVKLNILTLLQRFWRILDQMLLGFFLNSLGSQKCI